MNANRPPAAIGPAPLSRLVLTATAGAFLLGLFPACGKNAPPLNDQNPAGVQGKGKLQPAPDGVPGATPGPAAR